MSATSEQKVDPQRVQQALVCMLFDPSYEARIRGDEPVDGIAAPERELLKKLDPRALRTDSMRRPRAVQAILEEYPVSAALIGIPTVDAYFASTNFREAVFNRGSMALAFADYLGDRARGIGRIEAAMARVRRPRNIVATGIGCSPRVVPVIAPRGSLAWYQEGRARLGAAPLQALAELPRPWRRRPPRGGAEFLLVEGAEDGAIAIGGASEPLVRLLLAAADPGPKSSLVDAACRLGAEPAEAEELLDDLLGDSLLFVYGATS